MSSGLLDPLCPHLRERVTEMGVVSIVGWLVQQGAIYGGCRVSQKAGSNLLGMVAHLH